jgi:hypothetical protein
MLIEEEMLVLLAVLLIGADFLLLLDTEELRGEGAWELFLSE